MEKALKPDEVEWRICAYLIRERRPASSSQIEEALKLPSLYWAEYHISTMVQMGLLNKKEGDRYDMPDDVKANFLLSYVKDYIRRAIQRFTFYLSFALTLSLIYAFYFIYLPRDIITNHLFTLMFSLFSILISIIEGIKFLGIRKNLGV